MILQKIFNSQNIIILLILALGVFLRFYKLEQIPAGFFCDEAAVGYNAYRILETGRDEYGNFLPIFFWSFEDYKRPLAIYTDIPFILIFKLTEVAVRSQAAFFGMITIVFVYLIGKNAISKTCGLWSAFIATTLPWLIHYSRIGLDYSTYIAMCSGSIFFLIKAEFNKNYIIPFFIFLGLTFYSYQPATLFVPILLILGLIIYRKAFLKNPKYLFVGLLLLTLISLPIFLLTLRGTGLSRFNKISILSANLTAQAKLNKFISNYFYLLSPDYFFIKGDSNNYRHFSGGLIPILPMFSPFLVFGLVKLLIMIRHRYSQLLLSLLIAYPLGGAIMIDGPFSGRSSIGAIIIALIIGIGINSFVKIFKKKIISTLISFLLIVSFSASLMFFVVFYFIRYPLYSSDFWGWQYGPRDIVAYFVKHQAEYDDEIMIGEFNAPEIFFKFYAPNDCSKCKIGTPDGLLDLKRKQLFAVTPQYLIDHPYKFITKKTVYYPNKRVAFKIGEVVQ